MVIHVEVLAGTLVHPHRPLLRFVSEVSSDNVLKALANAFTVERHLRFDHDPRLGLIALDEIAGRALAPATNDPGTAIEVVNALFRALLLLPADAPPPDADLPPVYRPTNWSETNLSPSSAKGRGEEVVIRTRKVLDSLAKALPARHRNHAIVDGRTAVQRRTNDGE